MRYITNNFSQIVAVYFAILILMPVGVCCIWPPAYKVNLSNEETFVISELLDKSDVQDIYDEEELIKKEELENLKIKPQKEKYFLIHQEAEQRNKRVERDHVDFNKKSQVFEEFNPNSDELLPWKAGFVGSDGQFLADKDIIYFDEAAETNSIKTDDKRKRSDVVDKEENYDYKSLKAEYESEVKSAKNLDDTLQYSTVKEEESMKDAVKALIDFKETPRNCTEEETKGIGTGAVECFWMEMSKPKTNNRILEKIARIIIVWTLVYIAIAIPCWCQYGWCCCCCRCKFCRPKEEIDEVKKFFVENPAGVFHDVEGNQIEYKPTSYEKYAQKKLEKEINRL